MESITQPLLTGEQLWRSLPFGVLVFDADGVCVDCNSTAEREFGFSRDEIIGWTKHDTTFTRLGSDGAVLPPSACPVELQRRLPTRGTVVGVRNRTGTVRWLSVDTQVIEQQGPFSGGTVVSFVEIRERSVNQSDVTSEPFGAWEKLPAAVVALDRFGCINFANTRAASLFGWERDDVLGRQVFELVPAFRRQEAEAVRAIVLDGSSWTGTFGLRAAAGRVVQISATISSIPAAGEIIGFVGVFNPIGGPVRASELSALGGSESMMADYVRSAVSPSEFQLLRYLASGLTNKEIAFRMSLSPFTVRDTVSELMRRLKAKNRAELAAVAAVSFAGVPESEEHPRGAMKRPVR